MARRNEEYISFGRLKGENSTDSPLSLSPGFATRTLNVQLEGPPGCVAVKRLGSDRSDIPVGTYLLHRHVPVTNPPAENEKDAELWAASWGLPNGPTTLWRKIGGAAWQNLGTSPYISIVTRAVSFNGKIFFAGFYATNRMLIWDGSVLRLAGLEYPDPPSLSLTGAAGFAVRRHYKTQQVRITGGATVSTSELSFAAEITPGTANAVRVTMNMSGITGTHWIVWGSADGVTYFNLSGNLPVSTLFFDDTKNPTTYTGTQAPLIGSMKPLPAATRIITDGNRLIMSGNGSFAVVANPRELEPRGNRVWYTPVLGSSDWGDDERVPVTLEQRNFLDIGENTASGVITEIGGPMQGAVFVFNRRRTWRLVPTGDLIKPYVTYPISDRYGAVSLKNYVNVCAVTGEDEHGAPALYFLSESGVYRLSEGRSVEFVSYDISTAFEASHHSADWIISYYLKKQLWLVTQTLTGAPRIFVYQWDVGRVDEDGDVHGGWTTWEHAELTQAFAHGVMHNVVPGVAGISETRVPYMASQYGAFHYRFPDRYVLPLSTMDGAVAYSGRVQFAPIAPTEARNQFRVGPAQMVVSAHQAGTLEVSAVRDYWETRSDTVSLVPESPEPSNVPRVIRTAEALFAGDVTVLEVTVADPAPADLPWRVHHLSVPIAHQEPR